MDEKDLQNGSIKYLFIQLSPGIKMSITRSIAAIAILSILAGSVIIPVIAEGKVLEESDGVTVYSYQDPPPTGYREEHRESVKAESSDGDTLYYRYKVTDFDASKHDVYLEVYYTDTFWNDATWPQTEQVDWHSGHSHNGDIKIEGNNYGYYLFIWTNEGAERCTLEYTIGIKESSSVTPHPGILMIPVVLLLVMILVIFEKRKRT